MQTRKVTKQETLNVTKKQVKCRWLLVFLFVSVSVWPRTAAAEEFSSTDYKVLHPVLEGMGFSSSTGFQLFGVMSQLGIGTSSAANFTASAGFLFYPFASSPAVSAVAGDSQVALSWSASTGVLGWTVTTYSVGQSTTSGGPYTLTNVGNVTSSARTGLTNGTTYYFVVRVNDAFGNGIATSSQVSSAPVAAPVVTPTTTSSNTGSGGGGGGGGVLPTPPGTAIFSGRAYPQSTVVLLKDAQVAARTIAGPDAKFEIAVSGLSSGSYLFSLHSEDRDERRSSLLTFPLTLGSGATAKVSGIFIAPTIDVDKTEVRRGDNLAIFGQTVPQAKVVINVNSDSDIFLATESDTSGIYSYDFDTSVLPYGGHTAKSKSSSANLLSNFGYLVTFKVGTENVTKIVSVAPFKGDVNADGRVNLVDFSIAAFWYKRPSPPPEIDWNKDGVVDITDFSIMAFYWTG